MQFFVADYAQRHNIKRLRVVRMMILLCRFVTIQTMIKNRWRNLPCPNSIMKNIIGFCSFGIFQTIFGLFITLSMFSFEGMTICSAIYTLMILASLCVLINFHSNIYTSSAPTLQAIGTATVFREFGEWQNRFALGTSFCLNCIRHIHSFEIGR